MRYIYSQVLTLEGTDKVGTKQCVALIQHYLAGLGPSFAWKEGGAVYGNQQIAPGTVIATFVNGRYPNHPHGNHAAFFLRQGVHGFWVMDQWANDNVKPKVSSRFIRIKGAKKLLDGRWPEGGNNAYAYSIVER
jgi:hypothetical protein